MTGLGAAQHARVGALWAFRAEAEAAAAARFGALAGLLARTGAAPALVTQARRAAADEARHRRQCVALAARFGREVPERPLRVDLPGAARLPEPVRAAQAVVALCCVAETLSAVLLSEMRKRTTDEPIQSVVHQILRDEVGHARLGWAWLDAGLTGPGRAHVAAILPALFADTVQDELFSDGPDGLLDVEGYGGLGRARRRAAVGETLRGVVLPGLARAGVDVDAGTAWVNAHFEADARPA